ncbi:hypothetical protein M885DRAFT_521831 [Pelagophyceae sp. CCMP2097]|nr:hypothetical protein M885DRAFT_521831 [Pelagophyceae sp. CCMP2097]
MPTVRALRCLAACAGAVIFSTLLLRGPQDDGAAWPRSAAPSSGPRSVAPAADDGPAADGGADDGGGGGARVATVGGGARVDAGGFSVGDSRDAFDDAASGERACGEELFVVHWTHVPKAGGTAFASLTKKVACVKNPQIASSNPCCVPDVCVSEGSCFATASTCPLVQGIGKHTSNMDRLPMVPCCGTDWYRATVSAFMRYALRAVPDAAELATFGARASPGRPFELQDLRGGKLFNNNGLGRLDQLQMRVRSYETWPMAKRVEFFATTGVDWAFLKPRLRSRVFDKANSAALEQLGELARSVAPNVTYGVPGRPLPKVGQVDARAETCRKTAEKLQNGEITPGACCTQSGANSMTMLRSPFVRAVSAFFYRGHSPNYDAYGLRPGLWVAPSRFKTPKHVYTFKEFLGLDEYSNILTKMFGASRDCLQAQKCSRGTCAMTTGCHGYRNASSYLSVEHADLAVAALGDHAFFGFLEAYNASVYLAYHTFGITVLDPADFKQTRQSNSLAVKCSPASALRYDSEACRFAFASYELDFYVYEKTQRIFCKRLFQAGLADKPDVKKELEKYKLCDDSFSYANSSDVCGLLETPAMRARLKKHRDACGLNERTWRRRYGFYGPT